MGPGGLEYGGGLNLNRFDANGNDVGSIIDTLDDAAQLRGFVTVMSLNKVRYENWVVSSVAVSPDGVRHVTAVRNSYAGSDLEWYGFPLGEEVIVRVIGVGASGPMDTDADDFTLTSGAGTTDIRVTPAPTSNLDVKATLYRILDGDSMEKIADSDPPAVRVDPDTVGGLDASISATTVHDAALIGTPPTSSPRSSLVRHDRVDLLDVNSLDVRIRL